MENNTATQKKAALGVMVAITETIREAGVMGVPAGHLYAGLMTQGCTMQQYEQIERILIGSGLVRKSQASLLTWAGPEVV